MFYKYDNIISENQKKKMKGMDLIMKKLKEELKYGKRGITLISLVVTIIVLLILAGVTIATLTGDNGILTRAQDAKTKTEEAEDIEKIRLAMSESQIGENGYQKLNETNFKEALENEFTGRNLQLTNNEDGSYIIDLDNMNKVYYADTNGQIISDENMIEIGTADDLKAFRDDVNSGNNYEGKYVYLTSDITINEEWNPIGKYDATSSNPDDSINRFFSGIFDGRFHKIYNLNINATEKSKGLFGLIKGGIVKNLGIDSGNISSNSAVGGIVGYACNNTQIINCYNKANIIANDRYAGGIIGYAKQGVRIENCCNAGLITAKFSSAGPSCGGRAWRWPV